MAHQTYDRDPKRDPAKAVQAEAVESAMDYSEKDLKTIEYLKSLARKVPAITLEEFNRSLKF